MTKPALAALASLLEHPTWTQLADRQPSPGMPLWVKAFIAIAATFILLLIILHLAGLGLGPTTHAP